MVSRDGSLTCAAIPAAGSYAMIAGVGPILGTGIAGYFVDTIAGRKDSWGYYVNGANAGAWLEQTTLVVAPTTVYALKRQNPRVAVPQRSRQRQCRRIDLDCVRGPRQRARLRNGIVAGSAPVLEESPCRMARR